MQKLYDVVALGELLIDLTPYIDKQGVYQANAGGAPANMLTVLAKCGRKVALVARVGKDSFGRGLIDTLRGESIDCSYISVDDTVPTTLAVVALDNDGNRDFSFYRNPGADCMLSVSDLDYTVFSRCSWFHFGSLSLTHDRCREATVAAVREAKKAGAYISFDPNLREPLWADISTARARILECLSLCDVVKMSEDEAVFLSGVSSIEQAAKQIIDTYAISALFVTLGDKGAVYASANAFGCVPTIDAMVVDTTGAGDAFMGMVIERIIELGVAPGELSDSELAQITKCANICGALATRKKGGIPSIPAYSEVLSHYRNDQ